MGRWGGSGLTAHMFFSVCLSESRKPHLLFRKTPIVTHNLRVTKAERPVPFFKERVFLNMLRGGRGAGGGLNRNKRHSRL